MENMRELNREEMEQASGGNVNGQHYNIRYLKNTHTIIMSITAMGFVRGAVFLCRAIYVMIAESNGSCIYKRFPS